MHNITSPQATSDDVIEQEIRHLNKQGPRVTLATIKDSIRSEHYFTAYQGRLGALVVEEYSGVEKPLKDDVDLEPLKLLTFCVLVLNNGFTVTGESACVSPENFDAEIGKKVAFENAKQKIWPLEGYLLKQQLRSQEQC